MMKLKHNIIKGIIIVCFFCGGASLHAQGIFSDDDGSTYTDSPNDGGLFRDGCDDEPGGCSDPDKPPAPPGDSPIGEGIVILSLLSGAYAMVQRNRKNKYED